VLEALFVSWPAGCSGAWSSLPLNGFTTATMNFQTFSHLSFAFRVTPAAPAPGPAVRAAHGPGGRVPPAVRAAGCPVTAALRDL
jgi:putative ABC transport system permease protein